MTTTRDHHSLPPALQDVAGRMEADLRDARVENGALKRKLETLEALAMEARGDIAALREERAGTSAQVSGGGGARATGSVRL